MNTLNQRLADARLEVKLWILSALALPIACAAGGCAWLYAQRDMPALWLDYQAARALDALGFGALEIPGWHPVQAILDVVPRQLDADMLSQWDGDLARLAAAASVGIAAVALVLAARLAGFSFLQKEA